jgi:rSAM-associated Gly-rich repeat protein
MISRSRTLRVLSLLLPAGALGISVALASAPAKAMVVPDPAAKATSGAGVAERLQAIRVGVSQLDRELLTPTGDDPNIAKAWWANGVPWFNGGFRNGGWGNGGFRNGGWGNGGFRNGGWGNGWHNGWRNW